MLIEINENLNNGKSVTEKLSEKERTTCYLYCEPEITFLSAALNYYVLIERLERKMKEDTRKFSHRVRDTGRVELTEIVPLSIVSPEWNEMLRNVVTTIRQVRDSSWVNCAHRFRMPATFL